MVEEGKLCHLLSAEGAKRREPAEAAEASGEQLLLPKRKSRVSKSRLYFRCFHAFVVALF